MEETKTSNNTISEKKLKNKLPPVRTLIEESWHLLSSKALKLLILAALVFVISFLIVIFFAIIGLVFGGISLISNPQSVGIISILIIGFIVAVVALTLAVQAAYVLILGDVKDEGDEISVISYLKKGFLYSWKLLLLGLLTMLFMIGGLFLFFIPAFIISIFLMFSVFILIIENKSVIESVRLSAARVSQFFGAIIGRVVLLWILSFAIQMIIGSFNFDGNVNGAAVSLSVIFSILVGWFSMAYVFKLYVHTREAYDPEKKSSITWIWVVTVLGWFIGGLIIFGFMSATKNINVAEMIKTASNKAISENSVMSNDIDTNMETEESLTDQVLTYMNVMRASSGLEPLTESQQLCAYSARRLKQMKDFEGFDDYAGFYEDMGNQATGSTFFRGYSNIVNIVRDRQVGETEAATIGASIVKEQEDNAIFKSSFSDTCVRADNDFVSIVIGEKSI